VGGYDSRILRLLNVNLGVLFGDESGDKLHLL
jgi:hypothetical protein